MCGITGIISKKGRLANDIVPTVAKMNAALTHRGPDSDGYYDDNFCALAMRRLSIIDLDGGKQPIFNESKSILVFLNGEIYNYLSLKSDLEQKGHIFRTKSDTEVLVHLYEAYGESMFAHLRGMFSFCLYDIANSKFLIARDSFGEKPLFYYEKDGIVSFSSEIRSLLQNEEIERILDKDALLYYLRTSLVPEPLTMFQGIMSLKPGHFIRIEKNSTSIEKYFSIEYKIDKGIKTKQDAIGLIKPVLEKAVMSQSMSDVPIGSFLSGGIDSSTVVALLQTQSANPIDTFHVKFEDEDYDESGIAKSVADHCGTKHHEIVISNYDFKEEMFWDIIDHVGQPFRDSSAIPTYYISKKIREHVKVAISGDGGDELFGGYSMFQWYLRINKLKYIPKYFREFSVNALEALRSTSVLANSTKLRQVDRAIKTSLLPREDITIALNEMFNEIEINDLLSPAMKSFQLVEECFPLLKSYPEESSNWSPLRKVMYYRTNHTLTSNMLVKVDRMSMANSLEVRAPFLDIDLFKASAQLPDKFLIDDGVGKSIVREIMKDKLPKEVFSHPKKGFSIPLFKYQNETFKQLASRLLFEENPFPGLFQKKQLESIFIQGIELKKDNNLISVFRASHQLWMIMQLLGWAQRFKVQYE